MKKIMLLVILSIIIIAVYGSFLLLSQSGALTVENGDTLNNTSPECANQTYNVKKADFKLGGGWGTPGGVMAATSFNITIQNFENKDLNGLSLEVKMLDANGSKIQAEAFFYGPGIIGHNAQFEPFDGILHAGETRTIRGEIISDWGTMINTPRPLTTVASIKLGNETLDEWTFTA